MEDTDIIERMNGMPILVIGDIMLDRFVYGKVKRISPEGPVPVLSVERENMMLGGAGNTLSNLMHLGCKGRILSIIGEDEKGRILKDVAQESGIDISGLIISKDYPTIVKTRYLAGHQQMLRADYERSLSISKGCIQSILDKAAEAMDGVKAVILSDYGKGLLTSELIKELIAMAHAREIPVLVDPKGTDFSKYASADIIKPNKKELSESTGGMPVDTDEQVEQAAIQLIKTCDIGVVVATRSQDGMSVIRKKPQTIQNGNDTEKSLDFETIHIRSAEDIEVFDVSGAGDTVIATIAAAIGVGSDVVRASLLANVAGSIVVSKVGTASIRAKELLNALSYYDLQREMVQNIETESPFLAPVMKEYEAREEIQRWKARGLKVGFTNGCFDIIHYGHVTYLNDARQQCDRLIVGLNNDASVRLLKGENRPVHDEESRARVISSLGAVDMVVLFGAEERGQDNTPRALISQIQPDIFFKGGDYTIDQLPEASIVTNYGGKVEILPVCEGHSTTQSIKKVRS
ncbi:MAG: D-glycero-beta-D-manno-heptose 1-phosphate adenylyltransferase [Alphaproteobacteria bacterium]|nr:D-glycero-beta-D-manno-heptose 1-phosphate adenylyltransferase [Alphaproteobacteria bacterium]